MSALIRAELLKLRTTRVFWIYIASTLAFVPLSVALAISNGPKDFSLASSDNIRNVMAAASAGSLVMLLLGISMTAGEFRHNTATTTFLITPDRRRALAAKLAAGALVGVCVGAAASLVTLAIALPWLKAKGVDVALFSADVAVPVLGSLLATTLAAIIGNAVGAALRLQTLAITVVVIWTGLAEPLLVGLAPQVGRWVPGGAAGALANAAPGNGDPLGFWAAAAVLAGYAVILSAAGLRRLTRTDIA